MEKVFTIFRMFISIFFFFFNDTATTEIYTLSLHDALPISGVRAWQRILCWPCDQKIAGGSVMDALPFVNRKCVLRRVRSATRQQNPISLRARPMSWEQAA